MFHKVKSTLDNGVIISTVIICTLIFFALVPYTLGVIDHDFEEKASTLARQYAKCLDSKFNSIKNYADVIVSEYGASFNDQNVQPHSTNTMLTGLFQGSPYPKGLVIVTPDATFSTNIYCSGSGLYSNFGKQPFAELSKNDQPRFLVNVDGTTYRDDCKMIYVLPVKSDNVHIAYHVLIFFDPIELIQGFKLEQNWFLDRSSIIVVTKDNEMLQMKARSDEPLTNTDRKLHDIPKKRADEYIITHQSESGAFSIVFYISKNVVIQQSAIIIAFSLLLLLLACGVAILCTRRYSRFCEMRLNNLIYSMDRYIEQHTEEIL